MNIFHITTHKSWRAAKTGLIYRGDTLASDGFIHCCLSTQIKDVLENWFQGREDLVVLEINPDRLKSPIIYENLEGDQELFPHIYGPINIEAVIGEELKKNRDKEYESTTN